MTAQARTAVACASVGHALCHGSQLALRIVLGVAALDFGVGLPAMGWCVAAFTIAMGAASLPGGLLADKLGAARVLGLYFWALAAAAGLCVVAPSFPTFVAAHALLGAAAGLYHPAGLGLLSLSYDRDRLGHAMGVHGVAGSVGIALTPVFMLAAPDWRTGLAGLAVTAALAGLVAAVLRRKGLLLDRLPAAKTADASLAKWRLPIGLLLAVVVVNAFQLEGFTTMLTEAVRAKGDVAWGQRVEIIAILVLGGVGQYVGGLLARGPYEAVRYAMVVALQPVLLVLVATNLAGPSLPLVFMASFAMLNYMTQPIENHMLAAFTSRARRSTAYATKFLVGLVLGAPAAVLAPWVAVNHGYPQMFTMLAAVGVVGTAGAVLFLRTVRRRQLL